jgi:hypothetical protein
MLLGRVVQNSKISARVDLYPKSYSTNISANTQQTSDSLQAQFTRNPIAAHLAQRNATDDRPVGSDVWENSSAHVLRLVFHVEDKKMT